MTRPRPIVPSGVLARVQGMLGLEHVVTPVPQGGRTPAERVHWVPWGEPRVPLTPAPTATELPALAGRAAGSRAGAGARATCARRAWSTTKGSPSW